MRRIESDGTVLAHCPWCCGPGGLALLRSRPSTSTETTTFAYQKGESLLSPAEGSFLGVLEHSLPTPYRIALKVRLADVISPEKGLSRSDWQKAFNSISSKHLDFVLLDLATTKPILALELDDKSHQAKDRSQRDQLVDQALHSAGLKLVRIAVKPAYSVQEVQQMLGLSQAQPHPQSIQPQAPAPQAAHPSLESQTPKRIRHPPAPSAMQQWSNDKPRAGIIKASGSGLAAATLTAKL